MLAGRVVEDSASAVVGNLQARNEAAGGHGALGNVGFLNPIIVNTENKINPQRCPLWFVCPEGITNVARPISQCIQDITKGAMPILATKQPLSTRRRGNGARIR